MKKLLLLVLIGFLSLPLASPAQAAEEAEACISDEVRAAVSPRGECEIFQPCESVPGNYRTLPVASCRNVRNQQYRPTLAERMRSRRGYGGGNYLYRQLRSKEETTNSRRNPENSAAIKRRVGSASIYRSHTNKEEDDKTGYDERRGRTIKDFSSRFRNYRNTTIKPEVSETAQKNRRGLAEKYERLGDALRKEAIRDGAFSNKPRWSVEARKHSTMSRKQENPYWDFHGYKSKSTPSDRIDVEERMMKRSRKIRLFQFRDADLSDRDLSDE